ncbi:MAG: GNAT family protein [Acidobacteriota bacterium]
MFVLRVDDEIELRLLEEHHAEEIFALVDANRAHLRQWLPWVDEEVSANEAKDYIKMMRERLTAFTGMAMGIWHQGRLAGAVSFVNIDQQSRWAEIGYWIDAPSQGHGIITQSCRAMINYAFDDLKLNRIVIRCADGNHRSRAIPERLGFLQEGRLRQTIWLYDRFWDALIYGMLANEWNAQKQKGQP